MYTLCLSRGLGPRALGLCPLSLGLETGALRKDFGTWVWTLSCVFGLGINALVLYMTLGLDQWALKLSRGSRAWASRLEHALGVFYVGPSVWALIPLAFYFRRGAEP